MEFTIENGFRISLCLIILVASFYDFYKKKQIVFLFLGLVLSFLFCYYSFLSIQNENISTIKRWNRFISPLLSLYGALRYKKNKEIFPGGVFLFVGIYSVFIK
jgi:uncharacterized membrane protein (UPF0136 family)